MMMKKLKEKKDQYNDPVILNDPSKKVASVTPD